LTARGAFGDNTLRNESFFLRGQTRRARPHDDDDDDDAAAAARKLPFFLCLFFSKRQFV
jgi:hypothetical protein